MATQSNTLEVTFFAPSSQVPAVEFEQGLAFLKDLGFSVAVPPAITQSHLLFAGTDQARCEAFLEVAKRPDCEVLWAARGGSGILRLLPLLPRTPPLGVKPKKVIGSSDVTPLLHWVQHFWGWPTAHGPLPGSRFFGEAIETESWKPLLSQGDPKAFRPQTLRFWNPPPASGVRRGSLEGGNLSLWAALQGTPFAPESPRPGAFLFLEEVSEPLYRVDRMFQQLALSGALEGLQGILLGTFFQCHDTPPEVLKAPGKSTQKPLRAPLGSSFLEGLRMLLTDLGLQKKIWIAEGLPAGHGPGQILLPLGGSLYELSHQGSEGRLVLQNWGGF